MRNVLLLAHDDPGQESRYQAALDVVRALGGHLTCLHVTIIPEYVGDYARMYPGGLLLRETTEEASDNSARLIARLEKEDVSFEWIGVTGYMPSVVEDHSALSDLIVVSSDEDAGLPPSLTRTIGDLIRDTGKPILAVPPAAPRLKLDGRTLIAWDGSADAEAALQASVPLLAFAERVTLFYVDDGSIRTPIEEAAKYLSRHGIEPVVKREAAGIDRAGVAVFAEIAMGHHDLLVMGGYGHSPVTEMIFGGTTRAMLRKSRVPMIIAHHR